MSALFHPYLCRERSGRHGDYYEKLRELREGQDLKQSDVALVLGTTQQVYSRYENGINELPLRHLITLCGFYRVSADVILGLMDEEA